MIRIYIYFHPSLLISLPLIPFPSFPLSSHSPITLYISNYSSFFLPPSIKPHLTLYLSFSLPLPVLTIFLPSLLIYLFYPHHCLYLYPYLSFSLSRPLLPSLSFSLSLSPSLTPSLSLSFSPPSLSHPPPQYLSISPSLFIFLSLYFTPPCLSHTYTHTHTLISLYLSLPPLGLYLPSTHP